VIENWPEDKVITYSAPFFPDEPEKMGYRDLPMSREIYIERDDFRLAPEPDFYRLAPGREVRLRWGGFIHCHEAVTDQNGKVTELRATFSEESRSATLGAGQGSGQKGDKRAARRPAIIHWVSAKQSIKATVRLYDRLFLVTKPTGSQDSELNSQSLNELVEARLEPSLAEAKPGDRFQFERLGYFIRDTDGSDEKMVFNRIVTLKDSRAKRS
jgi:glutaminyl-tRNA synthetase